jgi:serine/threonine protein kinase
VFLHILASVLAGVEHMHTMTDGVGRSLAAVHFGIKPDNILVFPGEHDNVLDLQFKVGDLGSAEYTDTLKQRRAEDPSYVVVSVR